MAKEIEFKFLVKNRLFEEMAETTTEIIQGYIDRTPEHVVRVRKKGGECFLTVKGKNKGAERLEFEYSIPEEDFRQLLTLCSGNVIEKVRYLVKYEGFTWEVDVFKGNLKPLVLAEVEVPSIDTPFPLPPFVGEDVTNDPRYYNSNLISPV